MRRRFNLSLYLVVGPEQVSDRHLVSLVGAAVAGGVTMVQLRDKNADTASMADRARTLLALLRPLRVPLIVNDDPEAALTAGADGVHVGPFDRSAPEVRRLIGEKAILGLSVTSLAQAAEIDPVITDYVGLGPVFATRTKPDAASPLGVAGLRATRRKLPVPTVAIGGIDAGNLLRVMRAGVDGIAVVSAICGAKDPRSAARQLAELVQLARTSTQEAGA